jgi:F0F1-type ATP synthase assembly protein I
LKDKQFVNALFAYSTAGLQLAIILVLFVYGGYRLDLGYDTSPVFVLIGSFFGMGVGLYNMIRGLKQIDDLLAKQKKGTVEEKRKKWL